MLRLLWACGRTAEFFACAAAAAWSLRAFFLCLVDLTNIYLLLAPHVQRASCVFLCWPLEVLLLFFFFFFLWIDLIAGQAGGLECCCYRRCCHGHSRRPSRCQARRAGVDQGVMCADMLRVLGRAVSSIMQGLCARTCPGADVAAAGQVGGSTVPIVCARSHAYLCSRRRGVDGLC
jgi:hypothetical protein